MLLNSYLQVNGDIWLFDYERASDFMRKRIAALVKSHYLRFQSETDHTKVYKVIGTKKEYIAAMDTLTDGR